MFRRKIKEGEAVGWKRWQKVEKDKKKKKSNFDFQHVWLIFLPNKKKKYIHEALLLDLWRLKLVEQ